MKHTKSKLISSIVVLVVCFAMLIGSTFAWFTDSASTGVNKIQAGNLDVQLLAEDGTTSIEGGSLSWCKADDNTDVLWEPGATYRTGGFKIKNNGNLDLKFKIAINGIIGGDAELLNVIDFYLTTDPNSTATTGTSLGQLETEYNLSAGQFWKGLDESSDTIYLLGHMKEEAGNTYQGKTLEGVSITLYATQLNSEFDSFGNDYDEFSEYDVITTGTSTSTIKNGQTNKLTAKVAPANDASKATVVELPEGLDLATGEEATATLTVTASPVAVANTNFTVSDNNGAVGAIDLKLTVDDALVTNFDGQPVKVITYIAKNMDQNNVSVEYVGEGDQPTEVTYNPADGELTFKTTHFSTFAVKANEVAYVAETDMAYSALEDAIDAAEENGTVVLLKDCQMSSVLLIEKSITIIGNGNNLYNTANRVIRITQPNLNVKLYDLGIISKCTATSDVRGISFDDASDGSSLLLDGCNVSASFYAINISAGNGANDLNVTIKNGTVAAGWAAINSYSNNSIFTIENSVLKGLNDKGESSWNDFATIVFDSFGLNNSNNIGTLGSNNTMNITNSTIYASSDSNNNQAWLALQYGAQNNKFILSNVNVIDDNGKDQTDNMAIVPFVGIDWSSEKYQKSYDTHSMLTVDGEETLICYHGEIDDEVLIDGGTHVPFTGCPESE